MVCRGIGPIILTENKEIINITIGDRSEGGKSILNNSIRWNLNMRKGLL